jgi:hypothetical protein
MLFFFWSLISNHASFGQLPFVISQSIPTVNDSLFYQIDDLPRRINISRPGQQQVWTYNTLVGPYLQFQTSQASNASADEIQLSSDQGLKQYYTTDEKTLIQRGISRMMVGKTLINRTWISVEGLALPSLDMDYQDDHDFSAVFQNAMTLAETPQVWKSNLPAGMDSIRVSILVDRNMTVDASGTLYLGNGYREEVQRFKVEDHLTKKLWAKKVDGNWQDITSLVRLEDLLPEHHISYHFVSLESGGNICSVFLDQNGTPRRASFLIPKEQSKYYKTAVNNNQWIFAYPNPALSYVRFKFLDVPTGEYTLRFYDVFMRNLFEKKYTINGEETVEISIIHLEK